MPILKNTPTKVSSAKTPPPEPSALDTFASSRSAIKPRRLTSKAQESSLPGKADARLGKTVRFSRAQWKRLRIVETDLEMNFQELCFEGLNRILAEQGLPPL
jgi:hypothetical protein